METLRLQHHTDWILWILLGSVVLVVTARLYNPQRFRNFLLLPFHVKRRELESSFNPSMRRGLFDMSLSLMSYALLALGLFLLLHPYRQAMPLLTDWQLYLRLLFVLLLFFLSKNMAGLFVGWIFGRSDEIAGAQNVGLAYRTWLAILVLPICALLVFFAPAYQLSYYLLAVVLAVGYYFALQFSLLKIWSMQARPYYKIFYLCALEITPLFFLLGWLKSLYQ